MKNPVAKTKSPPSGEIRALLAELKRLGSAKWRDEMAERYGIRTGTTKVFGTTMADIQKIARRVGRDHARAAALWESGWYEARMLAPLVEVPESVTPTQMDRWCADFDNWAVCDTACMHLFDRTTHAFAKIGKWSRSRAEFVRRAAFALCASVALHDKKAPDENFIRLLALIEDAACDERNFVKKAVNWALRAIGERNRKLNLAAITVAERLANSTNATERWVGKDALRQFARPAVARRLAKRG